MSYPANLIGFGAAAAGGAYIAYQAGTPEGGTGLGSLTMMQWLIGFLLLAFGFYFAVVLS